MFATCTNCRNMAAPSIRAPRRMIAVYSRKGEGKNKTQIVSRMCYPQCARKGAFLCRSCGKWHDRTLLHALCREQNNSNTSLCKTCHERNGQTVCASCHSICAYDPARTDSTGVRCDGCFNSRAHFTSIQKSGPLGSFKTIIKTEGATRTYGIELEVNSIHNCDTLAKELGALNIEDVEFEVKRDGSIHAGFEVTTFPADLPTIKKAVEGMCTSIRKYKHNYDNAGMHVHVKDPNVDIPKLFKLWYCVEGLHVACLPHFRRMNQYCRQIVGGERLEYDNRPRETQEQLLERVLALQTQEQARGIAAHGRYHTLNLRALDKYGTIEFRAHHATTDYREITHFLTFLDYVYKKSYEEISNETLKEMFALSRKALEPEGLQAFNELGLMLGLPAYTLKYLASRKTFYDNNKGVTAKTLGVPRRFRFDNGDTPAEIVRRRQAGDTAEGEEESLERSHSGLVIAFSGSRMVTQIEEALRLSPEIRSGRYRGSDLYIVADRRRNAVWAYQSTVQAIARSNVIRSGEIAPNEPQPVTPVRRGLEAVTNIFTRAVRR